MAGSREIYPPPPGTKLRVHLEDHHQDFLWLDIGETKGGYRSKPGGRIVGAGPFQGWLWKGKRVKLESLKVGKPVAICMDRKWTTIKYPVTRIERVS